MLSRVIRQAGVRRSTSELRRIFSTSNDDKFGLKHNEERGLYAPKQTNATGYERGQALWTILPYAVPWAIMYTASAFYISEFVFPLGEDTMHIIEMLNNESLSLEEKNEYVFSREEIAARMEAGYDPNGKLARIFSDRLSSILFYLEVTEVVRLPIAFGLGTLYNKLSK